jgi:EVE domain
MRYWLKALGSSDPAHRLPDDWRTVAKGILKQHATFSRRPLVEKGDGIVYYASGTGLVFAVGTVTSHPYHDTDQSAQWPWRVDVELSISKHYLHHGARLEELNCKSSRNDVRNRIKRRSHVQLSVDEYDRASKVLQK